LGTALVYPTFICHCTGDNSSSGQKALAFFGFEDLGYAIGAIISGITADLFKLNTPLY
jgi:hypothetical protein